MLALNGLLILVLVDSVLGHGFMLTPPSRNAGWRTFYKLPRNQNDNSLNCGGFNTQHAFNGGRCGCCGDDYALEERKYEPGPGNLFATGKIGATYTEGEIITVRYRLTAFHEGKIMMKLCVNEIPQRGLSASVRVTQECLDLNPLIVVATNETWMPAYKGDNSLQIKLPDGVYCEACVLQWRYRTGNNWGCDTENGRKCGVGLGIQENFINCADIRIRSKDAPPLPPTTAAPTPSTPPPTEPGLCRPLRGGISGEWCEDNCFANPPFCPPDLCKCSVPIPTAAPTAAPPATEPPATTTTITTEPASSTGTKQPTSPRTYPTPPLPPNPAGCRSVSGNAGMTQWCVRNCNFILPFCPANLCVCDSVSG